MPILSPARACDAKLPLLNPLVRELQNMQCSDQEGREGKLHFEEEKKAEDTSEVYDFG